MLEVTTRLNGLQRGRKIFKNENDLGTTVVQLVFQLTRRVHRVDVDHHTAGTQDARDEHRILQHIGHHHRHAAALPQTLRLQPGGHTGRQLVQFSIGQRSPHAAEGHTVFVLAHGLVQQGHQ